MLSAGRFCLPMPEISLINNFSIKYWHIVKDKWTHKQKKYIVTDSPKKKLDNENKFANIPDIRIMRHRL